MELIPFRFRLIEREGVLWLTGRYASLSQVNLVRFSLLFISTHLCSWVSWALGKWACVHSTEKTAEICDTVFLMAEHRQALRIIAFGKRKKRGIPQKVYLFQTISLCFLSPCKCKASGQKCRKTQVNKSEWMTERVWGEYYRPVKEYCSL